MDTGAQAPAILKKPGTSACASAVLAALAVLLSACQHTSPSDRTDAAIKAEPIAKQAPSSASRSTAYRIRSGMADPLNADTGWAAALNSHAEVLADQPFRLRFEVENRAHATNPEKYRVQYRYNGGPWQMLIAENFPQPAKEVSLNYTMDADQPLGEEWTFPKGDASCMIREAAEPDSYLRIKAREGPVIALMQSNTHWQPNEVEAVIRFPDDQPTSANQRTSASIVFAYLDADNYRRLDLDSTGQASLVHVIRGTASVIARHRYAPVLNRFFELKLSLEDKTLSFEYDGEETILKRHYSLPSESYCSGLQLQRGSTADLQLFTVQGLPQSPLTSIIEAGYFPHGAPTENLLQASELPFIAGAGLSFAATTPGLTLSNSHTEWEFPIVIRHFSDGAAQTKSGDVFEYRLAASDGSALPGGAIASVTLKVPARHLGGTFVETPMRLGPWQSSDGSLYFLMEPAETWNALIAVQSRDFGLSWNEVDGTHRPETGDLEGFASRLVGDRIHMLHQTSDEVVYHVFNTVDHPDQPNRWAIRDEWLASPIEPPTQVADLAVRSDGSVVAVYGGADKLYYQIRSTAGNWSQASLIGAELDTVLSGPSLTIGPDDVVHLAYNAMDGRAWYRQILTGGELTAPVEFADGLGTSGDDAGSILPLVYSEATDEVVLLYRLASGQLRERRVRGDGQWSAPTQVTKRAVVQNAVDSEQTGADAIAYGDTIHVLFIEAQTGQLYHTSRQGQGDWSEPSQIISEHDVQWVRGALIKNADGRPCYGFVTDNGSDGGSGMNSYGEIPLR